jgi:ParB/RepB/Spo0J family partition protein
MMTQPLTTEDILLADIETSPFQPRSKFKNIDELAANIVARGLDQPITVRLIGDRYQLVFGERRVRACRHAGLKTISAMVREMTDDEVRLAIASEVLNSDDLSPLEEAAAIQNMIDAGWNYEQIATQTGRSIATIARRAQLSHLTPEWTTAIDDPTEPVSTWSASHLLLIARMPAETQAGLLSTFRVEKSRPWKTEHIASLTLADLRSDIADQIHIIAHVPWKQDDACLVPEAGACSSCIQRTDAQPELFDPDEFEIEPGGKKKKRDRDARCLNAACWARKEHALVLAKEAELRAAGAAPILLSAYGAKCAGWEGKQLVGSHEVGSCKKSDPGAIQAIHVDGARVGQTEWVNPYASAASGSRRGRVPGKPRTVKERREVYDLRRAVHVGEAILERLDHIHNGEDIPELSIETMLGLACAYGTYERRSRWTDEGGGIPETSSDWGRDLCKVRAKGHIALYNHLKEFTAHSMSLLLYRSACGIVASCLRQTIGAKDPKQVDRRGTEVCGLLGLEYATLRDEAIQAIPYPKCWEKLNANGTPKVAKETKTAAATESTNSTTETPGTTKRGRPRKS